MKCQTLLSSGTCQWKENIATDYQCKEGTFTNTTTTSLQKDSIQWTLCRSTIASHNVKSIPWYNATESLLSTQVKSVTQHAFTSIIPYPTTEQDTICKSMKNFQDVLIQKNLEYGPLWCDKEVYRIAKEIQLLKDDEFENIFLCLGGFHTWKLIVAFCGQYLEESSKVKIQF